MSTTEATPRTRPLPARKSLGTAYNLRPRTERVPAIDLRVGDVVLESADDPVRLTSVFGVRTVRLYARYIWQADTERPWLFGYFHPAFPVERAVEGEY